MRRSIYPDPDPMNARCLRCAECGGECYEYGEMYTWTKRGFSGLEETLICPECLEEHILALSTREKAELAGSRRVIVGEAFRGSL